MRDHEVPLSITIVPEEVKQATDELIAAGQHLQVARLIATHVDGLDGFYDPDIHYEVANAKYRHIVYDADGTVVSDALHDAKPPVQYEMYKSIFCKRK